MAIEASYQQKINEIKDAEANLTGWEKGFVFGKPGESDPIDQRDSLSDKQKNRIDQIYKERVEGMSREESSVINFGCARVQATLATGSSYQVVVDDEPVGPTINSGEAVNVVSWLSKTIEEGTLVIELPGGDFPEA